MWVYWKQSYYGMGISLGYSISKGITNFWAINERNQST